MAFNLFTLETSTGSGDAGGEGTEEEDTTSTESQEDTSTEQQSESVPRSELAKANAEAAKYRKRLRETEKRVEELEGHSKTEVEKERDRAAKAEQELQDIKAKNLVLRAASLATQAGVSVDAARDAALLLDWERVDDPEDDAEVIAAFQELVKEKPYLGGSRRGSADGGKGGGEVPPDMNAAIRQAAGRT